MEHEFTKKIKEILEKNFGNISDRVFSESDIIQYLNIKTKSASKGSKSRGSFANLYAVYVLVEDYLSKEFHKTGKYAEYEGAVFTNIFKRQRELPFGQKLQNHALNHRMNEEFKKYFRTCDFIPILRSPETNRYWFNENLLKIKINEQYYNLAKTIIGIIDKYVETKKSAFEKFIRFCESSQKLKKKELIDFVGSLVEPTVDARVFEIVSYSILKYYYHNRKIYWGFEIDKIQEENLKLYKTGRTNANDGGIDFVMKPLGRFFQVTETVDVNKKQYSIRAIVSRYMKCIEEIINIPILLDRFQKIINQKYLDNVLDEIVRQSKVEFSYDDDYDISDYEDIKMSE